MGTFSSLGLLSDWILIQSCAEGLEYPRQHRSFFAILLRVSSFLDPQVKLYLDLYVAHAIPLYSALSASFFLTDHKGDCVLGEQEKVPVGIYRPAGENCFALLCHGNVTTLAMSCLDFEGFVFFQDFFFFNLDHF